MDGRLDYKKFHNLLENATATFSMKNTDNGVFKIINKESQIVEVLNGDNPEFYIQYNWNVNDTLESGLFEGQFRIDFLDECSYIIVPIREKLYINILSSFTKAEIEENNNLIDSDSCLIYCQEYQFTGGTVSGTTEFLSDVNICEGDLYVHNILGCSPITINNNLEVDEDLFTISGETRFLNTLTGTTAYFDNIFSGNTDLSQLIINTFTTGGTYSNNSITLTRNDNVNIVITGITDYFTTGSTFDSNTKIATFNRNDGNNYTLDLSTLSTVDTFVTGFTYDGVNTFTIEQNEGKPDLSTTINDLILNSLSATTIFSGGTLLQTIIENIVLSNSPVYIRRHDFTGDTITSTSYCGTAIDGSLENQPLWYITKIDIPLSGSGTISLSASGVTWTGRYTHIYT
jgi:hypothetical protein